jgi:tRNA1(Val) A37 N6-methylase TrmN6
LPAGDGGDESLAPGPEETLDAISGHWKIFQRRQGHRYSTDDLLTAWCAIGAFRQGGREPRRHLDLGCGIGSVGLMTLWSFPHLRLVGVEVQGASVALARRSLRYNGVAHRAAIRWGDLRAAGVLEPEERFDLITASPPYLRHGEGRRSTLSQRGPCRFEDRGCIKDYLVRARQHLGEGGVLVWVHATRYLEANLAAAASVGLPSPSWRSVVFREGRPSLITLFSTGDIDAPRPKNLKPLTVRDRTGEWTRQYARIRQQMGFPA